MATESGLEAASKLGFSTGGVLSSRSVMLPELEGLLALAPKDAGVDFFRRLVVEDDALQKTSISNRLKTFTFVKRLYGLSPELAIYREFRRLSLLFPAELTTMAGLLAYAREPLLRDCADRVMQTPIGESMGREHFEAWIREYALGRYSQTMYVSFSHNLYASFYQLGYLGEASGKSRVRCRLSPRPASVAFAAFLDWLTGLNGLALLEGRHSKTLELGKADHLSLLTSAGQLGLMRVAHAGGVLHIDFTSWLQAGECRLTDTPAQSTPQLFS